MAWNERREAIESASQICDCKTRPLDRLPEQQQQNQSH